jgi:hypothetical protein
LDRSRVWSVSFDNIRGCRLSDISMFLSLFQIICLAAISHHRCKVWLLRILHALAWAKNTLWARLRLSRFSRGNLTCMIEGNFSYEGDQLVLPRIIVPRGYSTWMTLDDISARMTKVATMTSDHISATTTYVMLREEHLWNASVLQRVYIPNLVWMSTHTGLLRKAEAVSAKLIWITILQVTMRPLPKISFCVGICSWIRSSCTKLSGPCFPFSKYRKLFFSCHLFPFCHTLLDLFHSSFSVHSVYRDIGIFVCFFSYFPFFRSSYVLCDFCCFSLIVAILHSDSPYFRLSFSSVFPCFFNCPDVSFPLLGG